MRKTAFFFLSAVTFPFVAMQPKANLDPSLKKQVENWEWKLSDFERQTQEELKNMDRALEQNKKNNEKKGSLESFVRNNKQNIIELQGLLDQEKGKVKLIEELKREVKILEKETEDIRLEAWNLSCKMLREKFWSAPNLKDPDLHFAFHSKDRDIPGISENEKKKIKPAEIRMRILFDLMKKRKAREKNGQSKLKNVPALKSFR